MVSFSLRIPEMDYYDSLFPTKKWDDQSTEYHTEIAATYYDRLKSIRNTDDPMYPCHNCKYCKSSYYSYCHQNVNMTKLGQLTHDILINNQLRGRPNIIWLDYSSIITGSPSFLKWSFRAFQKAHKHAHHRNIDEDNLIKLFKNNYISANNELVNMMKKCHMDENIHKELDSDLDDVLLKFRVEMIETIEKLRHTPDLHHGDHIDIGINGTYFYVRIGV